MPPLDQSDGFPFSAGLLEWQPGETLYSLICRQHRLSGRQVAAHTCQIFFGSSRAGTQHDFPTRLDEFARRTGEIYGGARELACTRTLLNYYVPFRPKNVIDEAVKAMRGPSLGPLKYKLGILTSRFRAHHPLKSCPVCREADLASHRVAHWHIVHQYPGVWACPDHGLILQEATVKATGAGRFLWYLPADTAAFSVASRSILSEPTAASPTASELGRMIRDVVGHFRDGELSEERLRQCYRLEIGRKVGAPLTRTSLSALAPSLAEYVRALPEVPELQALPRSPHRAIDHLERFALRPPRSGTHPVRHLVLLHWLFGNHKRFMEAFQESLATQSEARMTVPAVTPPSGAEPDREAVTRRETLLKLVLEDGLTATAAARLLSLDVSTAMFWLAQAGHSTQRRAKVLGDERRKRLVADLLRGTDKAILARKYAVSEVTITRTLRTTPGLQAAWHAARLERARRQARARWSRLVTRHPGEGVKSLRAMAPAVFAWLYRNDGDWLANCNSQLGRKKSTPTGRVKWDERDRYLAAKIEAASSTLFVEGSGRLIARWQLCQLVPDLKPQLAHLRRLPLTARAIEIATRRPPEDTSLPLF